MNIALSKDSNISPLKELDTQIAFLKYSYDFLNQMTQTSEVLKLRHLTYFLAMATIETSEHMVKLQSQRKREDDVTVTVHIY